MTHQVRQEEAAEDVLVEYDRPAPARPSHEVGPFVTISREAGSGGYDLAAALAESLPASHGHKWVVQSDNLVSAMLKKEQLPSYLTGIFAEEVACDEAPLVSNHPEQVIYELVGKLNAHMKHVARAGHSIFLGHGANFATTGVPNGIHVRLVAPAAFRTIRTAIRRGIPSSDAARRNLQQDAARRDYVNTAFGENIADPCAYDFILNADRLPKEAMVAIIKGILRCPRMHPTEPNAFNQQAGTM